ncbi:chloride channel [Blastocladiella britannica]|nr:chloride channel [Blastocladiella britannica]
MASHTVLLIIIGLASGFYYYELHHWTFAFNKYRFDLVKERMNSPLAVFGVLTGTSAGMALIGFAVTIWEPSAAGSGMPELVAYLNGVERPRYISWRTLVAKIIGMVCIVNSGLFSGYDGPLIHVCMVFAIILVRNLKKVPMLARWLYGMENTSEIGDKTSLFRTMRSNELRMFATVGAATGVASAFQAPLAGVCFAIEEAISHFDPNLISKALFASTMSLVALAIAYPGKANGAAYSIYAVNTPCSNLTLNASDYLLFALIGIIGGLAGGIYNKLVAWTRLFRARNIQTSLVGKFLEVAVLVVLTSGAMTVAFYGPKWKSWETAQCTPFTRAVEHFTKAPAISDCVQPCSVWLDNSSATTAIDSCSAGFQASVCATDAMWTQLSSVLTVNAGAAAQNCAKNSQQTVSILPTTDDLETTLDGVKLALPDLLYTDTTLVSKLTAAVSTNSTSHLVRRAEGPIDSSIKIGAHCYYQMPSLVLNQAEGILNNLFQRGMYYLFEAGPLAIFLVMYVVLSIATHNITMPTDMVMPSLVIGAIMGRLIGIGYNQFQRRFVTGIALMDPGAASLLGMCAFWAGTSRMMITIIVVALQSTGDMTYLNGVTLVVLLAKWIGDKIGPSQFHLEIEAMELPYLPHQAPPDLKSLTVKDLIKQIAPEREGIIYVLPLTDEECTVGHAIKLLTHHWDPAGTNDPHSSMFYNGFPVVDRQGRLEGLLLRSQLERIVADIEPEAQIAPSGHTGATFKNHRMALSALDEKWRRSEFPSEFRSSHKVENRVLNMSIKDIVMAQMNKSPHTIQEWASANKAFHTFRSLALRHLVVVSKTNKVLFVLTRRDFSQVIEGFHHAHGHHGEGHGATHDDHGDDGHGGGHDTPSAPPLPPRDRSDPMAAAVPDIEMGSLSMAVNKNPEQQQQQSTHHGGLHKFRGRTQLPSTKKTRRIARRHRTPKSTSVPASAMSPMGSASGVPSAPMATHRGGFTGDAARQDTEVRINLGP